MSTITDTMTTTQDQILEVIEKIQEPVVDAVRTVVETVEGILPEDRPSVPFADAAARAQGARRALLRLRPEGARQPARLRQGDRRRRLAAACRPAKVIEADGRQEGRLIDGADRRRAVRTSSSRSPGPWPGASSRPARRRLRRLRRLGATPAVVRVDVRLVDGEHRGPLLRLEVRIPSDRRRLSRHHLGVRLALRADRPASATTRPTR